MKTLVRVLQESDELAVELLAGGVGLSREIAGPRVQRPGLALAGHLASVRPNHVQVLGNTELDYLLSLDDEGRTRAIDGLCQAGLACIVVTRGREVPARLRESADRGAVPLFRSALATESFINRIHNLLDEYLSPETNVHGVLVDVFGVGMLLTGQSGIGKSECALDLVLRGHRLVADDVVVIKQMGRQLLGMGSELTRHHMEVRGLGIINAKELFGAASVRQKKRVELIVEMSEWMPDAAYDRLGIDEHTETILGIEVPRIHLPIRPGRNVASIVEVAARNHLLKLQGHHSARQFQEVLERRLASGAAPGESE